MSSVPSTPFPPSVSILSRPLTRLAIRVDHPLSPNSPIKLHHLRDGIFGLTGRKSSDGCVRFHAGLDFVATPVYAVALGRVEWIRRNISGYGTCFMQSFRWRDGRIYFAFFAHLSNISVEMDQQLNRAAGRVIAFTGVTGLPLVRAHPCSSNPHLHFEIRTSPAEHLPDGRHYLADPQLFL
jgi:murein DD-endopeptidase MepM/ murein hydrolase activator NlpD